MTDLTVSATFTKNSGQPATGLVLAEIDLYLTQQDRATGVDTVIWDGTENPTAEMDNVGAYIRILTTADLDQYNYFATAYYTGATVLDQDYVNGAVGIDYIPLGTAIEFTYTVYKIGTSDPIEGVSVEIHRNAAGTDEYWTGVTDAFGVARDDFDNKPRLDPGTWYFFRFKGGYSFDNPDTEVVT
jgi:hypothetical protein